VRDAVDTFVYWCRNNTKDAARRIFSRRGLDRAGFRSGLVDDERVGPLLCAPV
jgi:hypothetical protein